MTFNPDIDKKFIADLFQKLAGRKIQGVTSVCYGTNEMSKYLAEGRNAFYGQLIVSPLLLAQSPVIGAVGAGTFSLWFTRFQGKSMNMLYSTKGGRGTVDQESNVVLSNILFDAIKVANSTDVTVLSWDDSDLNRLGVNHEKSLAEYIQLASGGKLSAPYFQFTGYMINFA